MNAAREAMPPLPAPLEGLADIALDLAWSWTRDARALFRALDPVLWLQLRDRPLRFLREIDPARLEACAGDPHVLDLYRSVREQLAVLENRQGTWLAETHADVAEELVAYFCAEFAVHHSVPIYSGGLGILAGDHLKSASDIGLRMVGVGLFYNHGYFDQSFDDAGWQRDHDEELDPSLLPLTRLHEEDAGLATVELEGRTVALGAWEMQVGRTRLILLDTHLSCNAEDDRRLTARLYGSGEELRLKQEWVLGTGGVRVLRSLGIEPSCWHANEGHAAFMMVERVRELIESGSVEHDAVASVRATSVFTTHTPVPAGHDDFTLEQIESCLGPVWEEIGVAREAFMGWGLAPSAGEDVFHMTAAAIRLSRHVNGVSERHGQESRRIWADLWPDQDETGVPIGHVTNGVHQWTWMAAAVQRLLDEELGTGWATRVDDPNVWDRVLDIPDERVWTVHLELKHESARILRELARRRWERRWSNARHLAAAGLLLDPDSLTLGFARRFATYKRADLLLRDEERLFTLLTDTHRPVQLVFAGKAHPADDDGKRILQRIHELACDARAEGRVAFVEDYEMFLAHLLLRGVDLWLNLPRVPMEASGTSGMKAAMNLVPQLGTLDGWWAEGFTGDNGWAIPESADIGDTDAGDWSELFRILEQEVVPAYHDRDADGVPHAWAARMKHALWVAASRFSTERMLREYVERFYRPAFTADLAGDLPPTV